MAPRMGQHVGQTGTRVVAAILVAALVCSMLFMFLHQHYYLHTATQIHSEKLANKFKLKGGSGSNKWDTVWYIAKQSEDEEHFLQSLRVSGLLNEVPSGQDAGPAHGDYSDSEVYMYDPDVNPSQQTAKDQAAATTEATTAADSAAGAVESTVSDVGSASDDAAASGATATAAAVTPVAAAPKQAAAAGAAAATAVAAADPELQPIEGNPPPMSVKLAHSVAVNSSVIVTWANYALWDFVKSWVIHVRQLGYTNFLVGAMDKDIGQAMVKLGIPSFSMYELNQTHSGVGNDHLQWGGEAFHKMGRQKITLAKLFLGTGLDLLLVDVDVVLLGDVMSYFSNHPQADVLVSSDNLAATIPVGDPGLELPHLAGAPMNIGFMFFRHNNATKAFVDQWLEVINADPKYWDQNAFNDLARAGWDPYVKLHPEDKRLFMGFNDSLAVGVLPVASFSGGHTYYIQRLHEVMHVEPLAVHNTFQYGANPGKRNRMREAMIFEDEPEYYTGDNYVAVSVEMSPRMSPEAFKQKFNYTQMKAYNVQGLNMQLKSVYAGIGLAILLNRTIIVPKIACYCDRSWVPLDNCTYPGATQQRLPFICPMDYVLDPIFMRDEASSLALSWRESTFLDNPRCPLSVKRSRLTVITSKSVTSPIEQYSAEDEGVGLLLPPRLPAAELKRILDKYKHYKVIHFKQPSATFTQLDDPQLQEEFQKRIAHLKPVVQPDNM